MFALIADFSRCSKARSRKLFLPVFGFRGRLLGTGIDIARLSLNHFDYDRFSDRTTLRVIEASLGSGRKNTHNRLFGPLTRLPA
jgi:hypothetical protein